ncbi:MAG: VCBS repeat-containing protein [Planctomycetes bacterium]|nr:VCBS repeat-containing protein [Planctomycetota bacterium]
MRAHRSRLVRSSFLGSIVSLLALGACANHGRGRLGQLTPLASIAFESRTLVATGAVGTACVVALDADRDGRQDLVTAGLEGAIVVALGQGGGTLAVGQTIPLGAQPASLDAADLDADGDLDLVAVLVDGTAIVLKGDGRGGFARFGSPFSVGPGVLDAKLGDLDGDAVPDLVVSQTGRSDFTLWLGVGDATFVGNIGLVPTARGATAGFPQIGDFDGDGRKDLAMADFELGQVIVLLGDSSGLPARDASIAVGAQCFGLASGDLDGDGRVELIASSLATKKIAVIGRVGPGTLGVVQELTPIGAPYGLRLADLDGDAIPDLAAVLLDRHALAVFRGLGGAFALQPTELPVSGSATTPLATDLDGDGARDLIVPAHNAPVVNLFRGRSSGGLAGGRFHQVPGIASPVTVDAGDFDGDGRDDVVTAGFTDTLVVLSIGRKVGEDLQLVPLATIDLGRLVQNVHAADVDRDGRMDLVIPVEGGVKILANRSTGLVTAFETIPARADDVLAPGAGPFEVVVGDVDGDHLRDLVIAYHVDSKLTLLRGRSAPFTFASPLDAAVPGRSFGLALGDFDGDGLFEIATSRLEQATVTILEPTAAGLVPSIDIPVGPGPNFLRAGDFDADGATDLVVSGGGSDTITVLMSLRGGSFRSVVIPAGSGPTALLAADLNRDGFDDVMVAAQGSSECRIVLGDGRGGFAAPIVFPALHQAVAAALADLDGDGLDDLLVGSFETRAIATFINRSRRD